jgi:ribosome-associated toxin RatA of RatAB toxin-antitoxin module
VGKKHAERQVLIEGTPKQCFEALVDYESFPDWQRAVSSTDVLTRDGDGRARQVAFEIDAKVRKLHYTLEYSYEEPHLISWDYVEGDVDDVEGQFVFEDQGEGVTLATYSLRIDPGMFLPGRLVKLIGDQVMKGSMEDLKKRIEG